MPFRLTQSVHHTQTDDRDTRYSRHRRERRHRDILDLFGTNDLTQYTLAVDRNDERIADRYGESHPAVVKLLRRSIDTCDGYGISTSVCGEVAPDSRMIQELTEAVDTSIASMLMWLATLRTGNTSSSAS